MSRLSRFTNLFRRGRLDRELEEELAAHMEEALEHGRSPGDLRRAFGSPLHHRERSRDLKLAPWLDALAADVVFGWRRLNKHRSASAASILSLALAIGAATTAFRLVDAVLLRRLADLVAPLLPILLHLAPIARRQLIGASLAGELIVQGFTALFGRSVGGKLAGAQSTVAQTR